MDKNWSGFRVELDADTASFIMQNPNIMQNSNVSLMEKTLDILLANMRSMYLLSDQQLQSGTILTYNTINQPLIQIEYNTDIIGEHYENSKQIRDRAVAQIFNAKCSYRNAQILTAAGYCNALYPAGYHIRLSDLDPIKLANTAVYADSKFTYKVNLLKFYVCYDKNDDMIERIWYRHYGTFIEIDPKNSIMMKPIQSIEIDSAVDYKLMQNIDLGYKRY